MGTTWTNGHDNSCEMRTESEPTFGFLKMEVIDKSNFCRVAGMTRLEQFQGEARGKGIGLREHNDATLSKNSDTKMNKRKEAIAYLIDLIPVTLPLIHPPSVTLVFCCFSGMQVILPTVGSLVCLECFFPYSLWLNFPQICSNIFKVCHSLSILLKFHLSPSMLNLLHFSFSQHSVLSNVIHNLFMMSTPLSVFSASQGSRNLCFVHRCNVSTQKIVTE